MKANIALREAKAKQTLAGLLCDDEVVHVTPDHMTPASGSLFWLIQRGMAAGLCWRLVV
jgi:hypothetical protein